MVSVIASRWTSLHPVGALSGNWVARLQRFASIRREGCELCGASIGLDHPHLFDRSKRRTLCVCSACFTTPAQERLKKPPHVFRPLSDVEIDDAEWAALDIPVGLAFLLRSSIETGVAAVYPGPGGVMGSRPDVAAWDAIVERNPSLNALEPDVEALFVNRLWNRRAYFLVSIDHCFALSALIRAHWRGILGGSEALEKLDDYIAMHAKAEARTHG